MPGDCQAKKGKWWRRRGCGNIWKCCWGRYTSSKCVPGDQPTGESQRHTQTFIHSIIYWCFGCPFTHFNYGNQTSGADTDKEPRNTSVHLTWPQGVLRTLLKGFRHGLINQLPERLVHTPYLGTGGPFDVVMNELNRAATFICLPEVMDGSPGSDSEVNDHDPLHNDQRENTKWPFRMLSQMLMLSDTVCT